MFSPSAAILHIFSNKYILNQSKPFSNHYQPNPKPQSATQSPFFPILSTSLPKISFLFVFEPLYNPKFIIMSVCPFPSQEGVLITIKLLLLGESSVGKTSLVNRYTNHTFDTANNLLTIGIEVRKIIKHLLGKKVRLELWDTSGQERFRTIPANYFRGIQGIMLVYDITSGESFFRVEDWLQRIDQNCVREKLALTLVGNKIDLQSQREVREDQAGQFAQSHQMRFKETSAKTAIGVDQMIEDMVIDILDRGGFQEKKEGMKLGKEDRKKAEGESCC